MITRGCTICKEQVDIHCTDEQYRLWRNGMLIQHAMPDVPKEHRGMLISGICEECWEKQFYGCEPEED